MICNSRTERLNLSFRISCTSGIRGAIDDDRFVLFEELENTLSEEECHVIDLVIHTYGLYSAKVLETITHTQDPWISARKGYEGTILSHEPIIEENIRNYFQTLHKQYDFSHREGINHYIHNIIM